MKKLLLIFTLMLTFVACSDENTGWGEQQRPVIEEVGYLNIADNGLSVIYEHELGSSEIDPDQQSKTRVDESQDGDSGSSTTEEDPCADYWMRLIRCGWQIWRGILPVSRQIKHLKIRTVHGISVELVLKMKEKHKIRISILIRNIGIP